MPGKCIVPLLAISIQDTTPEDLDVLATPSPEGYRFLEIVVEVIALPILNIVGELFVLAGAIHVELTCLQFTIQLDFNVIQETEIELGPDDIGMVLLQQQSSAVIRLFQSPEEILRDVIIGVA